MQLIVGEFVDVGLSLFTTAFDFVSGLAMATFVNSRDEVFPIVVTEIAGNKGFNGQIDISKHAVFSME